MTNEELERAVERLTDPDPVNDRYGEPMGHIVDIDDLRALPSERAELLAAVERMRELLETVRDYVSDTVEGHIEQRPTLTAMAREDLARIDAALTTASTEQGERG